MPIPTNAPIVSLYDRTGVNLWNSDYAEGVEPSDIVGNSMWDLVDENVAPRVKEAFANSIFFKSPSYYWITFKGHLFYVVVLPVTDAGKKVACCTMSWPAKSGHARLTPRESEVLLELGRGSSVREIADRIFVSESTVQTHVTRLREKLNLPTQAQVVAYASRFA